MSFHFSERRVHTHCSIRFLAFKIFYKLEHHDHSKCRSSWESVVVLQTTTTAKCQVLAELSHSQNIRYAMRVPVQHALYGDIADDAFCQEQMFCKFDETYYG